MSFQYTITALHKQNTVAYHSKFHYSLKQELKNVLILWCKVQTLAWRFLDTSKNLTIIEQRYDKKIIIQSKQYKLPMKNERRKLSETTEVISWHLKHTRATKLITVAELIMPNKLFIISAKENKRYLTLE